ncbi:hypothetical protein [Flavobacterium johnsoniae]|nr:hypothetical protein [Flavobacterium johnsoniae]
MFFAIAIDIVIDIAIDIVIDIAIDIALFSNDFLMLEFGISKIWNFK